MIKTKWKISYHMYQVGKITLVLVRIQRHIYMVVRVVDCYNYLGKELGNVLRKLKILNNFIFMYNP